jgi:hypothetical protein
LGGDETDNNKTNQAENETAALKVKKEEIKRENKVFPDKSYISKNKIFTIVI